MEVSNEKLKEYTRKLMIARMRLLLNNGFYGLLLMHMRMNISDEHDTAWSDMNDRLYFNPAFLEKVSDREMDYVMVHLLLHVVLKHLERKENNYCEFYDNAADIVANSNILRSNSNDVESISLENFGGVQKHLIPGGDEGWKYSVEEVCELLKKAAKDTKKDKDNSEGNPSEAILSRYTNKAGNTNGRKSQSAKHSGWDYHNRESDSEKSDSDLQDLIWQERVSQAVSAMQKRIDAKGIGSIPAFAERFILELKKPQTDWRTVLDEFIQEELKDYSFCPPDRRFDDSPFFLPDFNEKDKADYVEKILFMIDTSASMGDDEISQCYSEIKGAIDQFDGNVEGWLGFFDAVVIDPKPFVDEDEFKAIRPKGGGGTRFDIIFEYVNDKMQEEPPICIVILTDGYAPFPEEKERNGIPVLWIINNECVDPPWGKVARIT